MFVVRTTECNNPVVNVLEIGAVNIINTDIRIEAFLTVALPWWKAGVGLGVVCGGPRN